MTSLNKESVNILLKKIDILTSCKTDPTKENEYQYIKSNYLARNSTYGSSICMLQTSISVREIFNPSCKNNCFVENIATVYKQNKTHENVYLLHEICEAMKENKMIYIYLGLDDYIIDEDDTSGLHTGTVSHATALIFYPVCGSLNTYKTFHFNPHGHWSETLNYYEEYVTRYRKKEHIVEDSIDVHIIKTFVVELLKLMNDNTNSFVIDISKSYSRSSLSNSLYFILDSAPL